MSYPPIVRGVGEGVIVHNLTAMVSGVVLWGLFHWIMVFWGYRTGDGGG